MLAQFALVAFAMCAMLSLVIDVGYLRLTQVEMQNAADSAALEGLRNRDVGVVNPATGLTVNDPYASDCLRRAAANHVVHWTFDDDLDATNGDPDYQFGAGPVIGLTGGVTNLHALQTTSVPDTHVYKPDLQLNQLNQIHGDMVSGRYCYVEDPTPSEGLGYEVQDLVCTEPQRGSGVYARNDFNPNLTVPQPPSGLSGCPAADEPPPSPWPLGGAGSLDTVDDNAFLVRLRRSNELTGFDAQTEPDVASSGPSLPLMFGKGTTIYGDDPAGGYSVRRDGFTVRATAIAQIRPALHVGLPQTNPAQPGVTPFALADTFVQTLSPVGSQATINPANGLICSGVACVGAAPPTGVGRFIDNLTNAARTNWLNVSTVGQPLPAAVPVACALANTFVGYGPVSSPMVSGLTRIIGFSRITMRPDPARAANPCAKIIARAVPTVAPSNATASLANGLPLPISADPVEIRQLLTKNLVGTGSINYGPVFVPVLAR